jgi:hypothetical protein
VVEVLVRLDTQTVHLQVEVDLLLYLELYGLLVEAVADLGTIILCHIQVLREILVDQAEDYLLYGDVIF